MFFTHENIDGSGMVKKLYTKTNLGLLAKLIISVRIPGSPRVWALSKAAELVI